MKFSFFEQTVTSILVYFRLQRVQT